jgi:hypothetical protein
MPIRAVHRRALTLLAGSPEGLTVSLLFYAHNVPVGVLINLINEGYATVEESRRHGEPRIEMIMAAIQPTAWFSMARLP